jgi:serine/threonine protein kinase
MITLDGAAKLVDFGFALRIGEATSDPGVIGGAGYALGTFDFIPPEQAANAAAVTPQADQYSLGCSLYYSLAAQPPFPGGSAKEKMQKHRWEDPLPLSTFRPDLPVEFTGIVERLMAKSPADRFPSCRAAAKALAAWAKNAPQPQNLFAEDSFAGEDDLDQLGPFNPIKSRYRAYRREWSTFIVLAVIAVVLSIIAVSVFLVDP